MPRESLRRFDLAPEFHPLPDADTQALAALCQRRHQLLKMQQMETNRLERAERATRKRIKAMLRFVPREVEQVEQEIEHSIKSFTLHRASVGTICDGALEGSRRFKSTSLQQGVLDVQFAR
jgi:hypothetical protein